ncbi:lantibiotic dehydratase C-terminal domain-containing protein [Streptomyces sp. NPDC001127]|uniref:lantibiotic dehydratase C-terminal domain-containing protein n=1 Tax=unclassified Streptomyces TaxID=2593676 RepID=UPI00331D3774
MDNSTFLTNKPVSDPGGWQALHVFYAASPRPVITQCVEPLIRELTERDLLDGHFFINYWFGGPHVRIRLKPRSADVCDEIRERAEHHITHFLRTRPALYEVQETDYLSQFYDVLYELEYSDDEDQKSLALEDRERFRANNTFSYEPYEPEYGKYGGGPGVALAEWHFQRSSDLVMDLTRRMNLHVRTVLLGVSAQLMMVMSTVFRQDATATAEYLRRYHEFWQDAFTGTKFISEDGYERSYTSMADGLRRRFTEIRRAFDEGTAEALPGFVGAWAAHCAELRERVTRLAVRGDLTFHAWDGDGEAPVTDPDEALERLLTPYMHMTNNRLYVTIPDEIYLSYILARALDEPAAGPVAL